MAGSIKEEIEAARKAFPNVRIPTVTNDFANVLYEKTPWRRVKATLTFPDGYPQVGLIVSVSEVPPGVKKKLEKDLTQIAKDTAGEKHDQIRAVLRKLQNFMDTNLFVPCWRELRQSVELIQNLAKNSKQAEGSAIFSLNEIEGRVKVKLVNDKYHYTCLISIDEHYPSTKSIHNWGKACSIEKSSTNYPTAIETILTQKCQSLVRHLQDGMPEQEAFQALAPSLSQLSSAMVSPRASTRNPSSGNAHAQSSQTSNDAVKPWQKEEANRLSNYDIPAYDGSNPQYSLLSLVKFMIVVIQEFPSRRCPGCEKEIILADPKALAALYPPSRKATNAQRNQRPMHASCGCWYHYRCLDKFLTQPPFGDHCSSCGQKSVTHPDWPTSRSDREKQWANEQARKREMDDVGMMF